ncbi:transcriptional regulator [Lacticaseibacillus pantheris DSM 15945 = JCM 12539 = NBRC 106106]|jgi:DNA-binding LacI/PurR family transcriptional regulator|uniref:Transcriptional regulator n=1 Tax=Lacticaseibacillus pantheris DSM 15945 = JCM 12539 = NBRC 106106 TaxID=1423783 RepID=A0A0R1UA10_9LACO|nr:LacI family DNA-binding transcriptional regulator [Lacticaseibacillus pantheris]KRL86651.1 transcriptional regulator [Lacticaseibacillus pantheris DSM 15945 = JCM 12539 = NBRC 106106]
MTTIRDVARISGYSVSTVSRVLNHKNYVSDEVRKNIQKVIAELDYVPNDVARDLSRGRTMNIGVVVPNIDHPYYTDIVRGIMAAAFAAGYNVLMLPSKYDAVVEHGYLDQLRRHAFDGLIFTSHTMPVADMVPYKQYGEVVVCHDPGQIDISAAFTERGPSYRAAFRWVQRRHYRRVGLVLPRDIDISATSSATITAYKDVFGVEPEPSLIRTGVMSYDDGYAAAEYYGTNNLAPDFIFANGDDIAAGVLQYYRDGHLTPPTVMGQENQLSGQLLGIPTIDHHFRDVGAAALRLAIGAAEGQFPVHSDFIPR